MRKGFDRNCRKSPKLAIIAISHVIKSASYRHQFPMFWVFRQSHRVLILWPPRDSRILSGAFVFMQFRIGINLGEGV